MKLVQVQTPTCIANVAKYLETKGPLPFLFRDDRLGPSADVVLLREELVDGSVHLEYTTTIPASHTPTPRAVTESVAAAAAAAAASAASAVTAPVARAAAAGGAAASTPAGRPRAMLPQPAGVKFGRIVVALPTQSFILGAAASMSAYVAATPAGPRTSADLQPDAALCGARKVAADELRGLVSTSTAHAIEFWVSSAAPAGATIHVEIMIDMHSGGVLFNGARLA
nr:hypothetical protein HK105_001488 [Polyrhizophydium stewartii]